MDAKEPIQVPEWKPREASGTGRLILCLVLFGGGVCGIVGSVRYLTDVIAGEALRKGGIGKHDYPTGGPGERVTYTPVFTSGGVEYEEHVQQDYSGAVAAQKSLEKQERDYNEQLTFGWIGASVSFGAIVVACVVLRRGMRLAEEAEEARNWKEWERMKAGT